MFSTTQKIPLVSGLQIVVCQYRQLAPRAFRILLGQELVFTDELGQGVSSDRGWPSSYTRVSGQLFV